MRPMSAARWSRAARKSCDDFVPSAPAILLPLSRARLPTENAAASGPMSIHRLAGDAFDQRADFIAPGLRRTIDQQFAVFLNRPVSREVFICHHRQQFGEVFPHPALKCFEILVAAD